MKFPYVKFPSRDPHQPWIARPVVPIILENAGNSSPILAAMVDSGSDRCLFHADIGRAVGLKITEGVPRNFTGIEGGMVQMYLHKVRIQVVGASRSMEVVAGFSESSGIAVILGQEGFFDAYKITFHRAKDRIEIA